MKIIKPLIAATLILSGCGSLTTTDDTATTTWKYKPTPTTKWEAPSDPDVEDVLNGDVGQAIFRKNFLEGCQSLGCECMADALLDAYPVSYLAEHGSDPGFAEDNMDIVIGCLP